MAYVAPWQMAWGSSFHVFAQLFAVPRILSAAAAARVPQLRAFQRTLAVKDLQPLRSHFNGGGGDTPDSR